MKTIEMIFLYDRPVHGARNISKLKGTVLPPLSHNNGCGRPVLMGLYIMTHYHNTSYKFSRGTKLVIPKPFSYRIYKLVLVIRVGITVCIIREFLVVHNVHPHTGPVLIRDTCLFFVNNADYPGCITYLHRFGSGWI